jgi:cell division protein FtsQ
VSPVAAVAADSRFRRARVKPGRRRGRLRGVLKPMFRSAVAVLALGFLAYRASAAAARSRALQIDQIVVRGTERLSEGDVLTLLNGMRGESLVWCDLDAWRARLLASPWIRDAALRRSVPAMVEVVISERRPVGIGRINGELYLVDEHGIVIDPYGPQYANFDLPIIDGLQAADGATMTDRARAELAARVLSALKAKPSVARRVSQIDVTDVRNATVILDGDSAAIHLGDDQFLPRLESYLQLAPALRERVADIDYVDLRFEDRIYVRPARKKSEVRMKGSDRNRR